MAAIIEYVRGSGIVDDGISRKDELVWGFDVNGLESFVVQEDHSLTNNSYDCWVANDLAVGMLFTISEYSSRIREGQISLCEFSLCEVVFPETRREKATHGNGMIDGNYRVVARTRTPVKADRLFDWWNKSGVPKTLAYAKHCASHLEIRGLGNLPPLEEPEVMKKIISVPLDLVLCDQLDKIAKKRNVTVGKIIEQALKASFGCN